jgi:hypothetical protein
MRGRGERLEGGLVERVGGIALALGLLELFFLGRVADAVAQDVVSFGLEFGGVGQQHGDRREEDRGRLAPTPRAYEPADRLREEQGCGHAGRVHADGQPRDVHPLRHHPHRHHPAVI